MNNLDIYKSKLKSCEDAIGLVSSGDTIVHSMCVSEPKGLLDEFANQFRGGRLRDIYIYTLLALEHSYKSYLQDGVIEHIHPRSWFVSGFDRKLVRSGKSIFVPISFIKYLE